MMSAFTERLTSLLSGESFPVKPKFFPVNFHRKFRQKSPVITALSRDGGATSDPIFAIFPVYFPVSREFGG